MYKITVQVELFALHKGRIKKCRQTVRWEGDQQYRQILFCLFQAALLWLWQLL